MPLQNRVDPAGQLHAVPQYGTRMGNRGILHDAAKNIKRQWAHKAWVACLTDFGGTQRAVFSEGNYSELFFLDDVSALAAGHRPCKSCQRELHIAFKAAWLAANRDPADTAFVPIGAIDSQLHAERAIAGGTKRVFEAALGTLPNGAMFRHGDAILLAWANGLLRWSFDGYQPAPALPADTSVSVLTPPSIIAMLVQGYRPRVHPSADLQA